MFKFKNLTNFTLPQESIIFIILSLIIIRNSLIGDLYGTTGFNLFIFLLSLYLLIFTMKFSKLVIYMLLFISSLLLSTLMNHNVIEQGGYNTLTFFIVNLLLLSSVYKTLDIQRLFRYLIVSSLIFLGISYFFYLNNLQLIPMHISYVLAGPYLNQNSTSMILLSLMVFLVVLNVKTKILHIFIAIFFISILLTQARAALLAGAILLMYYYRKKLIIIIPLGLIALISFFSIYDEIFNRIYLKITEGGSSHRIEFWTYTISNMTNNFLNFFFGNGVNTTSIDLLGGNLSVHSSYVNFFANYGFVAIVLLFFLLVYILYDAQKYSQLLAMGLLSLLIHGLFETILFAGFSITWIVFIFLYTMRKQLKKTEGQTCT